MIYRQHLFPQNLISVQEFMQVFHNSVMNMAKHLTSFILFYTLFTAKQKAANSTKLILQLIHRNSIQSPFYNPKLAIVSIPPQDIRGDLIPYQFNTLFLVNVSIGEPPIPQLLILDTGSSLTWVCTTCGPDISTIFNPERSATYAKISCSSQNECVDSYQASECDTDHESCGYDIQYADGATSEGILATEKFTFLTSTGGIIELRNLSFGVGINNGGNTIGLNGILGLEGLEDNSLVARVGNKFSYCIGNISNPEYIHNQLVLGDGAFFQGYTTPMEYSSDGHYKVRLEGITIGDKKLEINQEDFIFNVVVDSGTTLTKLKRSGFEPLKQEVRKLMDGQLEPVDVRNVDERPCYKGNIARDLKGFPTVTLHLSQGADLVLDAEAMFYMVGDEAFCMAVDVANDINIIGILAQQYYNVGFDLNENRISFQRIDCELLQD